jgi:CRISPR system Cascade subunit CasA
VTDEVNPEFNLLDEPWIPVINNDNQSERVSIIDAVLNFNSYKSLDCELPSENFAVLRLLIAFLYSSLDLTMENWEDYWNDGFPEDQIRAYADKWHDRFWLIHPVQPFMQAADLRTKDGHYFNLNKIVADVKPTSVYYTRTLSSLQSVEYYEAAIYLLSSIGYDPCGAHVACVGDPRQGTTKGAVGRVYPTLAQLSQMTGIIPTGSSLKKTLLLCAPAIDSEQLQQLEPDRVVGGPNDRPIWEKDPLKVGGADKNHKLRPKGVIENLTVSSRRVKLVSNNNQVTQCIITAGDSVDLVNGRSYEQMCSWALRDDPDHKDLKIWKPVIRTPERSLWRGMQALLADDHDNSAVNKRPMVLEWEHELIRKRILSPSDKIVVNAVTTRYDVSMSSAVTDILNDSIPMPSKILDDAQSARTAIEAVSLADKVAKIYVGFTRDVAYASGRTEGLTKEEGGAQFGVFYAHLQSKYYQWLSNFNDDDRDPMESWKGILKKETIDLSNQYADLAPTTAIIGVTVGKENHVKSIATASMWLRKGLNNL